MSNSSKKKDDLLRRTMEQEMDDELGSLQEDAHIRSKSTAIKLSDHKRIRKVSPIGMRILVCIRKDSNVSEGGLYLPEGAKSSTAESILADVLEVATASEHGSDEDANISGIPLGSVVLIGKNAGVKVPWDENLRLVETKEVLALVHEMSLV
jgi:co-chaperonin GroES (HSP10)